MLFSLLSNDGESRKGHYFLVEGGYEFVEFIYRDFGCTKRGELVCSSAPRRAFFTSSYYFERFLFQIVFFLQAFRDSVSTSIASSSSLSSMSSFFVFISFNFLFGIFQLFDVPLLTLEDSMKGGVSIYVHSALTNHTQ